jgi:hypothetical protein
MGRDHSHAGMGAPGRYCWWTGEFQHLQVVFNIVLSMLFTTKAAIPQRPGGLFPSPRGLAVSGNLGIRRNKKWQLTDRPEKRKASDTPHTFKQSKTITTFDAHAIFLDLFSCWTQ